MEHPIAPCGVNCAVCIAHLREKKTCPGCLSDENEKKTGHCNHCSIRFCDEHKKSDFVYCFDCGKFPCTKMKNIDKRYKTKYKTSLINNLHEIEEYGMDDFLAEEKHRWICPMCGATLSVHRDLCDRCKHICDINFFRRKFYLLMITTICI